MACANNCQLAVKIMQTDSDPWYFYKIVTQNMLRTYKGKKVFSKRKKNPIWDSILSQMPYRDQITEIAPYVHTSYF